MWPMLGGLFSGLGSLAGGLFSSDQSAKNTQAQIQASQQQQATQNAFTEQMSSTAYQRASTDMQQAGLNPAMMFGSGSAASTPGGSSIQAPMPQTKSPFEGVGDAAGKMVSTAVSMKQYEKMTDEIANLKVENEKLQAVTENVKQSTKTETQETLRRSQVNSMLGLGMPAARVASQASEAVEALPRWARDLLAQTSYGAGKASDVLAPLTSTARAVRQFMPDKREVTRSGSRWNSRGEENHYEDANFEKRWTGF